MPRRKTTEDFITDAIMVHGEKYTYANAHYINNKEKVSICCPLHGEFLMSPNNHLRGQGCPKCGDVAMANHRRSTLEKFILSAKKLHGDKYDYSLVEYKSSREKVSIICPKHGVFSQTPSDHTSGAGCPQCANESLSERYRTGLEQFISRANEVHGNKYDYAKVMYSSLKDKVEIHCPIHGPFLQVAGSHLQGTGCPRCYGNAKATKEEFVFKARKVHGCVYDYSIVDYKNSTTKIMIVCPKHGIFEQQPQDHLAGYGCPICGGSHRFTTDEFIGRAKDIHGEKYDYSLVEYVNGQTKVKIICPEHGEFMQSPHLHTLGSGCPKCKGRYKPTTEEFVEMAKRIHGDKYDYSYVNYISGNRKVRIICPEHGEFMQTPRDHVYHKRGCIKCSQPLRDLTTDRFVQLAKTIHGKKYDYSLAVIKDSLTPVDIICPLHGVFSQTPSVHIWNKSGCPLCLSSHLEGDLRQLFLSLDINFEEQKEFEWLSHKRRLKLDFYLPEYNVAIECQGYQHFKAVSVFGGEDGYKITKRRDDLKRKLCELNGVKLLYYSNLGIEYPYDVYEDKQELLDAIMS